MAATLIIEDGTIVDGANSYAEAEDADEYWTDRGNTAWLALTADQKNINLIKACDYMEAMWRRQFIGDLVDPDQPRSFPRANAVLEGTDIDEDEIPERLITVQILLAERARQGTLLPDLPAGVGEIVSESSSVGPISTSKSYAQGTTRSRPSFPEVNMTVRPLLRGAVGGRVVR